MKKLAVIMLLLLPVSVFAEGVATGKIKGYAMNTDWVFVSVDAPIHNKPSCNTTNRFYFSLTAAYAQNMLGSILAAYHGGTTLTLTGTGDCNDGNSEVLRKICTLDVPC